MNRGNDNAQPTGWALVQQECQGHWSTERRRRRLIGQQHEGHGQQGH